MDCFSKSFFVCLIGCFFNLFFAYFAVGLTQAWFVFTRSLKLGVVGKERISQLGLKNAFDIFYLVLSKCIPSPCKNRGTCQEDRGSYKCLCLPGFGGSTCEGTSTDAPERGKQIK